MKRKDFFAGVAEVDEGGGPQPFGEDSEKRMQDMLDEVNAMAGDDPLAGGRGGLAPFGRALGGSSSLLDIEKILNINDNQNTAAGGKRQNMISFDNGISKQRSHGERLMPNSKRSMAKKKSATGAMAVIGNEIDADHLNRLE